MSAKSNLVQQLTDKATRDAFVSSQMSIPISFQLLALREQRGWTQARLAEKANMQQPRIHEMERPSGSEPNLRTLKRLASALDVALIVRFAPFSELVEWAEKFSPDSFVVPSFEDDAKLFEESESVPSEELTALSVSLPPHFEISVQATGEDSAIPECKKTLQTKTAIRKDFVRNFPVKTLEMMEVLDGAA